MRTWYLVNTKPGQQERADANIRAQSVETYLPRIKVEHEQGVITPEPAFAGYLFAKFDPSITSMQHINNTRGVRRIVEFGGVPAICPEYMIQMLKQRLDSDEVLSLIPTKGDQVEITGKSPWSGLKAIYQEPDKNQRSWLLLEVLGQVQRIKVKNAEFIRIS